MRSVHNTRTVVITGLGCALAVLIGAGIVNWGGAIDSLATWALAIGLILVGLVPICVEWKRGSFDLFSLKNAFVGYYIVQFGVWTLWILATGDTKFIGDLRAWDRPLQLALVYAITGLVVFHIGYYNKFGEKIGHRLPSFSPDWSSIRLIVLAAVLLSLGIFSFYFIVSDWGGLEDFLSELGPARIEGIRAKGYFLLMAWYFPTIAMLGFYANALEFKSKIYSALAFLVFLVLVGIGFSLGYRAYAVFPLLQLFCLQHYLHKRIELRPRYVLVVLFFIVLLNFYSYYRDTPMQQLNVGELVSNLEEPEFWKNSSMLFLRRFSGIETLALVIERFQTPEYGVRSLSYLLTFPIPRSLWREKTIPLARFKETVYRDALDAEGSNTTLPGELYWNFHLPGILLGMFLVGVFCRTMYSYLTAHQNKSTVLLYVVTLVYVIWMVEAPTTFTAGYIGMMCVTFASLGFLTFAQARKSRVAH